MHYNTQTKMSRNKGVSRNSNWNDSVCLLIAYVLPIDSMLYAMGFTLQMHMNLKVVTYSYDDIQFGRCLVGLHRIISCMSRIDELHACSVATSNNAQCPAHRSTGLVHVDE